MLADGRRVTTSTVVMAIGLAYYAHRPRQYDHLLSTPLVSHSCDHNDFGRFNGKQVIVVGGGESAIESAALLHEAGARVHLVSRRPIAWRGPDRTEDRAALERLRTPQATIAPGWGNWLLDHVPSAFYHLPQPSKDRYNSNYSSGASNWLRKRIIGNVLLHEGQRILAIDAKGQAASATISDGETLSADHVLLATGYKVDLNKLTMIAPALRRAIQTREAMPLLSSCFESTVPGLYFVGLTSLHAFGPLYRFVAGCGASARRVASAVARRRVEQSRSMVSLSWSTSPS